MRSRLRRFQLQNGLRSYQDNKEGFLCPYWSLSTPFISFALRRQVLQVRPCDKPSHSSVCANEQTPDATVRDCPKGTRCQCFWYPCWYAWSQFVTTLSPNPLMTDNRLTNLSILPPSYRAHPPNFSPHSQKGVHNQRWRGQSHQTGQLHPDQMLSPHCVSRKLACQCQGKQCLYPLCAQQALRAFGLLQAYRNAIRAPPCVAAHSDLDKQVPARFRPGHRTREASPTITGQRRQGQRF